MVRVVAQFGAFTAKSQFLRQPRLACRKGSGAVFERLYAESLRSGLRHPRYLTAWLIPPTAGSGGMAPSGRIMLNDIRVSANLSGEAFNFYQTALVEFRRWRHRAVFQLAFQLLAALSVPIHQTDQIRTGAQETSGCAVSPANLCPSQ